MPAHARNPHGFDVLDYDECHECGNDAVTRVVVDGLSVDECTYCGALFGDPGAVEALELRREAETVGIDARVYPMCTLLTSIRGLRTHEAGPGSRSQGIVPFIRFRIGGDADMAKILDRLMTSLTLINQRTRTVWHLEVIYEHGIGFTLKPKLPPRPATVDAAFIERCRGDLQILFETMRAHRDLSWWDV